MHTLSHSLFLSELIKNDCKFLWPLILTVDCVSEHPLVSRDIVPYSEIEDTNAVPEIPAYYKEDENRITLPKSYFYSLPSSTALSGSSDLDTLLVYLTNIN